MYIYIHVCVERERRALASPVDGIMDCPCSPLSAISEQERETETILKSIGHSRSNLSDNLMPRTSPLACGKIC